MPMRALGWDGLKWGLGSECGDLDSCCGFPETLECSSKLRALVLRDCGTHWEDRETQQARRQGLVYIKI